ncbi:MAG: 3-deoxy-7-phosphoheptulonate synthase [Gammaproteobacteria bacterium]|nr:3-deoxy-7-phosphoheptulonate synthase [Gammaproteobacteria bacterium]
MRYQTDDLKIREIRELVAPEALVAQLPISDGVSECVHRSREAVQNILHGRDSRIVVVVGPCSVHHVDSALEYAGRLRPCIDDYAGALHIIMRVYFEKPRTTVGWKGLINDPGLDDSFDINRGLRTARSLLLDLNSRGVSAATEYLDLVSPQYVSDLISWGAIGARTTESQSHRELASGLSCPVGFKNGTDGNIQIAIDALRSASRPHHFLSVTKQGRSAIFSTGGNRDCHIIMRGGKQTNYDAGSVDEAARRLTEAGQLPKMMVDFSHANSLKQHRRQMIVGKAVADQLRAGEERIMGVMVESNLVEGRQDLEPGRELVYGQSITDACLGWDDTVPLLEQLAEGVEAGRAARER